MESQSTQILSLEAALESRPPPPPPPYRLETPPSTAAGGGDQSDSESDTRKVVEEQAKRIVELEGIVKGYEEAGTRNMKVVDEEDVARRVREDVEKEWRVKVEDEVRKREEGDGWMKEVVKQLEKEKKVGFFSFFVFDIFVPDDGNR